VILEEGFPLDDLKRISESIAAASISAGVPIVTGDTKVVPKGKADRIFINTAGIGVVPGEIEMTPSAVRAGDAIILSGSVGDHGVTILASREGMEIPDGIRSDTAPLHHLTKGLLEKFPGDVRIMRDPTRGGVATVLCEIAEASAVTLVIEEEKISVKRGVKVVCDLLGLDPLYLANEGKCIIFTDRSKAKEIVDFIRREPVGKDAEIIGHVESGHPGRVVLKTGVGGERLLRALSGEPLPRIC
jgi:hydrogenase expression/formation protein HypE